MNFSSACALIALGSALISSVYGSALSSVEVVTSGGFCAEGVWRETRWPGGVRPEGLKVWGSFCGKGNDDVGRAESEEFVSPPVLNLYLAGYPGLPGRRLILKNVASGEERELTPVSTPKEEWRFNSLPVPSEWLGQRVRLVAEDEATGPFGWLGFSQPILPAHVRREERPAGGYCPDGVYGVTGWPSGTRPKDVETWGSFCKSGDQDTGWGASQPVVAGRYLNIYLAGYPASDGLSVAVENLQTGEELPLHPASPGETWELQHFRLPAEWKGQLVRVVSRDRATGPRGWVAFSEPVATTRADGVLRGVKTFGLVVVIGVVGGLVYLRRSRKAAAAQPGRPQKTMVYPTVAWGLTAVALLPAVLHWAAPVPDNGSRRELLIGLAYLAVLVVCYWIYRVELRRLTRSRAFLLVFVVFLLTSITNNLHGYIVDRGTNIFPGKTNQVWQVQLHNSVIQLDPGSLPHSYRFLPNSIVRWMEIAGIDFESARDFYRMICSLLLFYAVYKYARLFSNYTGAMIAMLLVAAIYPIGFEHYAGQLTDPLSHLSFVLAFIFLETEEFGLLLSTLLIGSLAKETVLALAGYYVLFGRKERNYVWKAVVLCGASAAVYLGVRLWVLRGAMHYEQASGTSPDHFFNNWQYGQWHGAFLLTGGALLPFLVVGWKETAVSLKRLALFLLPVLFVSSLLFSYLREARNYMPLVFVLAVSAGGYLSRTD